MPFISASLLLIANVYLRKYFFTSDNGGPRGCSMGPLRGVKGGPKYEGI